MAGIMIFFEYRFCNVLAHHFESQSDEECASVIAFQKQTDIVQHVSISNNFPSSESLLVFDEFKVL